MCPASVRFSYRPGLLANPFRNVRLAGSWDASGRTAADWSFAPVHPTVDENGCPAFGAEVNFDDSAIAEVLRWGVMLDAPLGEGLWGIASEVDDVGSTARERSFTLQAVAHDETYYLTHCGRFGALSQPGSTALAFLFGLRARDRSTSSSLIRRMAISPMMAAACRNRSQWRRCTAAFGRSPSPIS